jgi:hypothetical protein
MSVIDCALLFIVVSSVERADLDARLIDARSGDFEKYLRKLSTTLLIGGRR